MSSKSEEELRKWLEGRFRRIEERLGGLEEAIMERKEARLRIAWLRTLEAMNTLGGTTGTEQLAKHIGISRSVISEYLNRMEEQGLIKREMNTDPAVKARYLWQINWDALPPDINARLKKKTPLPEKA
jgi:DNA-binding MarR family transcriptional regulator